MSGPAFPNPIPGWLRPENASVFDSSLEKAIKMLAKLIGADDASGQALGIAAPLDVPGGTSPVAQAIEAIASRVKKPIRAYHGSPHDFDTFSLSKIGTGEGAQAYGHGLYFAENEGVAKQYRDQLTQLRTGAAQRELQAANGDVDAAIGSVRAAIDRLKVLPNKGGDPERHARQLALQEEKLSELVQIKSGGGSHGRMYEVDIHADPADFLDWDAPLSQQPAHRERISRVVGDREFDRFDNPALAASLTGKHPRGVAYDPPASEVLPDLANVLGVHGNSAEVSKTLKQQGIPGIKYLDGASRSAGQGSRNYVVFDDQLISIVKKYGIAVALGSGLINEAEAQQLKAQGYQ